MKHRASGNSHTPVLIKETIYNLNLQPGDRVIDGTVGAGGHSLEILKKIGPSGSLLAIDRDPKAIDLAKNNLKEYSNQIIFEQSNFNEIDNIVSGSDFQKVDAVLLDLGVSSMQLDESTRGFSVDNDSLLDMRMGTSDYTASDIVNNYAKRRLSEIIGGYGDFNKNISNKLADWILISRRKDRITTTKQLASVVNGFFEKAREEKRLAQNKQGIKQLSDSKAGKQTKQKNHPGLYRVFQALRIEVNAELDSLAEALPALLKVLGPGGRMAIISFHSGEDRLVKNFFKQEARKCICPDTAWVCSCNHKPTLKIITKKPITPGENEVRENSRSRSSKLRVAEKLT